MQHSLLVSGLIIIICLVFSAVFSGAETGIVSLNRFRVAANARKGSKNAGTLLKMMNKPQDLITLMLIGNNLMIVTGSALAASVARLLLGEYGPPAAAFIMTLGLLVFGEIMPKILFYQYATSVSLYLTPLFRIMRFVFHPVLFLIRKVTDNLLGLLRRKGSTQVSYVTKEELKLMISPYEQFVRMPLYEKEMIYRTFRYFESRVKDVLVPLADVISLPESALISNAVQLMMKSGHSRIPVYKSKPHQLTGMLKAEDIIKTGIGSVYVRELIKPVKYVSEHMKLPTLLTEFQNEKTELAIALDEYGEVSGIITIEDIIEEIVGEIEDEFDKQKKPIIHKAKDGSRVILGSMDLDTFNHYFRTELQPGEYKTVAGFLIALNQQIPGTGEIIKYRKWIFEILEATPQRVLRIKVLREK